MQRHGALYPFEDPRLDARNAMVFWRPAVCSSTLRVISSPAPFQDFATTIPLALPTGSVTVLAESQYRYHVLFAQDDRRLQLEVLGPLDLSVCELTIGVVPRLDRLSSQVRSLRCLADLAKHHALRQSFYLRYPRGRRLAHVLQALDGWLDGAPHREIAIAIFGEQRVARDWSDSRNHLRDQIRRAVTRGRALMTGGYLQLLK